MGRWARQRVPARVGRAVRTAPGGQAHEAFELYRWFLPLLRMDTVPKFVQLIKWVQEEVGIGSARVRAPRLSLAGEELEQAKAVLRTALAARPAVRSTSFPTVQVAQ